MKPLLHVRAARFLAEIKIACCVHKATQLGLRSSVVLVLTRRFVQARRWLRYDHQTESKLRILLEKLCDILHNMFLSSCEVCGASQGAISRVSRFVQNVQNTCVQLWVGQTPSSSMEPETTTN